MPFVAHQATELEPGAGGDLCCQAQGLVKRAGTRPSHTDIHFDDQIQRPAFSFSLFTKLRDVVGVVHRYDHVAMLGQVDQAGNLGRVNHLVGDQHIFDAVVNQHLGLAELGAGDSPRPSLDLLVRDNRCLVCLKMRSQIGRLTSEELGHPLQISVHFVQVNDQGRGLNIRLVHGTMHGHPPVVN